MLLKNINSCIVVFLLNIIFITGCFGETTMQKTSKITVSGGILKASALAYSEFNTSLSKEVVDSDLGHFLAKVENYDILIGEDSTSYSFTITPKLYKGRMLKGGGAVYIYGKKDFNLIKAMYYK